MEDDATGLRPRTPDTLEQAEMGAHDVRDQAAGLADQATQQASSLAGQVKDKAVAAASDGKEGLADRLDDLAQAVHHSGEQFAGQQDWIAGAIERGAAELGSLATSLRQNDFDSLFGQAKAIARRQPALFIGAALAELSVFY